MYSSPVVVRGKSVRLNDAGWPAWRSDSELNANEPSRLLVVFCENALRCSSVVNLIRCLLLALNHDRAFVISADVAELLSTSGVPPKPSVLRPLVPSSNAEFTSTPALGMSR